MYLNLETWGSLELKESMDEAIALLKDYVSHASISTDSQALKSMEAARRVITTQLESMGLSVEVVDTPKHPIVLAKRGGDPSWPHILLYGHYDVQPADPLELWHKAPFDAKVEAGRIYGRGTADNKGPQLAMLLGLQKALKANPDLPLRITVLIEGEEEIGSPSFPEFLKNHASLLKADLVLLSDTCSPSEDQIVVTTSLRGLFCLEVVAHGPKSDLHSGLYGGCILNPIQALTELCASLHTPGGDVNVPGFYDTVLAPEPWELEELTKMPGSAAQLKELLGVSDFYIPGDMSAHEAVRFLPTLEFNGICGGYTGEGYKTVIPSKASVKISCRLVPDQDWRDISQKLIHTLKERCPKGIRLEISLGDGGNPYLVMPPCRRDGAQETDSVLASVFEATEEAIEHAFGKKPLFLREGGSVPIIGQLKNVLGLDSVMIGLFTPKDNLHAPNESMDLELFEKGINAYAHLFELVALKNVSQNA